MQKPSARALFAARLVQARQMRGLSQRALGDRMGLGKERGSSRINRYEHQVTAIGFDSLETLAQVLDVPVAYLLADNEAMADAVLALAGVGARQQDALAKSLEDLSRSPAMTKTLLKYFDLPATRQAEILEALNGLVETVSGTNTEAD